MEQNGEEAIHLDGFLGKKVDIDVMFFFAFMKWFL